MTARQISKLNTQIQVEWLFEPRDWWIGLYWDKSPTVNSNCTDVLDLYLCWIPCVVLHVHAYKTGLIRPYGRKPGSGHFGDEDSAGQEEPGSLGVRSRVSGTSLRFARWVERCKAPLYSVTAVDGPEGITRLVIARKRLAWPWNRTKDVSWDGSLRVVGGRRESLGG